MGPAAALLESTTAPRVDSRQTRPVPTDVTHACPLSESTATRSGEVTNALAMNPPAEL